MNSPIVTVCVMTYNHIEFIEECLNSIINQSTKYVFEIVIGDDGSVDGTRDILSRYRESHPGKIKLLLQDKNIGAFENYRSIYRAASGRFVIHVDGDDFMLENKIEEQVNYLILNDDCVAVTHKLRCVDRLGVDINRSWPNRFSKPKFAIDDIALRHPIFGHSSIAFRREALAQFLRESQGNFIDFEIYLELAKSGYFGTINMTLGCYRVGTGISTRTNLYRLAILAINNTIPGLVNIKIVNKSVARQYYLFAKKAFVDRDFALQRKLIEESWRHGYVNEIQVGMYIFRRFSSKASIIYILTKRMQSFVTKFSLKFAVKFLR